MPSESVNVEKPAVRCRKRASNNAENRQLATTTAKRRRVSPPGEHDQISSADSTRHLATRLRNIGETDAAATKNVGTDGTRKIRYFSNFYRQPEPGEVFVGGRLRTGYEMQSDRATDHASQMSDHRPCLLPPSSPFPLLNFVTQLPHLTAALPLPRPPPVAAWGPVLGTVTSFPPCHVTACEVADSPYLCRRA